MPGMYCHPISPIIRWKKNRVALLLVLQIITSFNKKKKLNLGLKACFGEMCSVRNKLSISQ